MHTWNDLHYLASAFTRMRFHTDESHLKTHVLVQSDISGLPGVESECVRLVSPSATHNRKIGENSVKLYDELSVYTCEFVSC